MDNYLINAIEWAKEMGKIQLSYFRNKDLEITTKSNIFDVVTVADKACENYFREMVSSVYPDHSILGEENGISDKHSDFCWIVDPLDGTNNFSQGLPVFCVSIGLQFKGETIAGVVYAPYLKELYTAEKDKGAFLNGKPITISPKKELATSVVGTGFPYDHGTNPDNNSANIVAVLPKVRGIRRMGSAAYDLCCVGAGYLDGYWECNLHLWDICAGTLIVQEAGGRTVHYREDRGISIISGNEGITGLLRKYIR